MTRVILYTAFALVAFAFNSILCRLALQSGEIDAVGFTLIRLISGAAALMTISYFFGGGTAEKRERGNWISAFFLFAYAICFSLAYISLTTATGALILFTSVQLTMITIGLIRGERPGLMEWIGLLLALAGLVWLVFPGLAAPSLPSSALMAAAGISWGVFTLRGRGSKNALAEMTGNFLRSVPLIILISLPFIYQVKLSANGVIFAILSGSVASGIGYSVWYSVLKYHTATRAAILQLAVPVLAAFGGVIVLSETVSLRLVLASALILCGIGLAVMGRRKVATEGTEDSEKEKA